MPRLATAYGGYSLSHRCIWAPRTSYYVPNWRNLYVDDLLGRKIALRILFPKLEEINIARKLKTATRQG